MKSNFITVREAYDWISADALPQGYYKKLCNYIHEKYPHDGVVEYGASDRLRFINFVGIICLDEWTIEILPKISVSINDDRKALISMLHHARYINVPFYEQVSNGWGYDHLLDALLAAYVHRLQEELQRGVFKNYMEQVENRSVLRGKILVTEHLRKNAYAPTRVMCQFDEHSVDNRLNRILKYALRVAQRRIAYRMHLQIERCIGLLDEVEDVVIAKEVLNELEWNRQNERFQDVALFAKLIIEKASIHHVGDNHISFSFLFEMNKLFEAYVGEALTEVLGAGRVRSQDTEKKLLLNKNTNRMNIQLKPDFVTSDGIILDTKWKSAVWNGRYAYQQSDLYQMYAYVTAYKEVIRCVLVYPYQEEVVAPVWNVIDTEKTIEMVFVRLGSYSATKQDLKEILGVH
ncbi:McrC family protein [Paenibacillus solisilvae]|uniref:McrC family protein n=1 Tax=Paenibacillus solisilvae TaxID=2486751 RepID=A0ABW0VWP7_9BACL